VSWWKWSKEFDRFEWRRHVLKAVGALVGGDWAPVHPYDTSPPRRSLMLIGCGNVPAKDGEFRIEAEMLDLNDEPLPEPGSGGPWRVMDSARGRAGVSFSCRVIDADARRAFARADSLRTPYEVADFARAAIRGYSRDDEGGDRDAPPEPAPTAMGEMEPALVAAARDPGQAIEAFHGSDTPGLTAESLEARDPGYDGSMGPAVYLGANRQTAEFYGRHVTPVRVTLRNPLLIDPEETIYGNRRPRLIIHEGDSVLVGEELPPFDVFARDGERYEVDGPEALRGLGPWAEGKGFDAIVMRNMRPGGGGEEIAVFDRSSIRAPE
jgi:hypothetical protein